MGSLFLGPGGPQPLAPGGGLAADLLRQIPYAHFDLACFRGMLVVWDNAAKTFDLVDPEKGTARLIYREAGKAPQDLKPGPVRGPGVRVSAAAAGSMGAFTAGFAIDADGRIAFASGNQLGLLLLDWDKLGLGAKDAGAGAGQKPGAGAEERKESKGDSKAAQ